MKEMAFSIKDEGIRVSFRRYGWRLMTFIIAYYVVRDVMIYILIPCLFTSTF
jgi:hypothetical protein